MRLHLTFFTSLMARWRWLDFERFCATYLLWSSLLISERHAASVSGLGLSRTCRHHPRADSVLSTICCFFGDSYNLRGTLHSSRNNQTSARCPTVTKVGPTSSPHPSRRPPCQGAPPSPKLTHPPPTPHCPRSRLDCCSWTTSRPWRGASRVNYTLTSNYLVLF